MKKSSVAYNCSCCSDFLQLLKDEVQLQRNKFISDFGGFLPYVRLWGLAVDHSENKKIYWWTYIIHALRDTLGP